MTRFRLLTMVVAMGMVAGLCGCTTMGGQSDEELIAATVEAWKAGLEAQDIDMLMAQVSEDFEGEEGGGKPELQEFLQGAIDQGYIDNAEVDITDVETEIDGETASAYGLYLESDMGSASMDLELQKEADGAWRIVGMDVIT